MWITGCWEIRRYIVIFVRRCEDFGVVGLNFLALLAAVRGVVAAVAVIRMAISAFRSTTFFKILVRVTMSRFVRYRWSFYLGFLSLAYDPGELNDFKISFAYTIQLSLLRLIIRGLVQGI